MKRSISLIQLRQFGLILGISFLIIIGWILPLIAGHQFRSWTLFITIPSIVIGILKPNLLLYPYKFWMVLGDKLGWINSHIILGLVFILVLLPISLIMKIFGYDPLRKKQSDKNSYREDKKNYKIDLTRIF